MVGCLNAEPPTVMRKYSAPPMISKRVFFRRNTCKLRRPRRRLVEADGYAATQRNSPPAPGTLAPPSPSLPTPASTACRQTCWEGFLRCIQRPPWLKIQSLAVQATRMACTALAYTYATQDKEGVGIYQSRLAIFCLASAEAQVSSRLVRILPEQQIRCNAALMAPAAALRLSRRRGGETPLGGEAPFKPLPPRPASRPLGDAPLANAASMLGSGTDPKRASVKTCVGCRNAPPRPLTIRCSGSPGWQFEEILGMPDRTSAVADGPAGQAGSATCLSAGRAATWLEARHY